MKLQGKHIVITGATSGIGKQLAIQLNDHNKITVIGRDPDKLASLQTLLPDINIMVADLSQQVQVEQVCNEIQSLKTNIDILINNAAVQYTEHLLSSAFDYRSISDESALNFTSICRLTYLLLPQLQQSTQAVILNINSGLALSPKTSSAIYCASKAALNSFSQSLNWQLKDTNISVQQAFLPLVETSMTQGRGSKKMSANVAAQLIVSGLKKGKKENNIGKVKLLRLLLRYMPRVAQRIMKSA